MLHPEERNNQYSLIPASMESQTSLVAPATVSLSGVAQGEELRLAVFGSHAEINRYLDQQRALHGREVELHSADVITSEQKHRQLALLAREGRCLCAEDPGAPPRLNELTMMLAAMAADISSSGDLTDGEPLLLQRGRRLVMYDPRQSPPDVEIASPAACRTFFTQSLNSMYDGDWPYFRRIPDLVFHSLVPEHLPKVDRGFSFDTDGVIYFRGKRATKAQQKEFWAPRDDDGRVKTRVPDFEALTTLDLFTEQVVAGWLRTRVFRGVDDVASLIASQGDPSLAERMADLASRTAPQLWKGSKTDLARDVGWSESVMALNGQLRKITSELAGLGWCLASGGRTKGTQAREYVIMPLRPGAPENLGEIPGPDAE